MKLKAVDAWLVQVPLIHEWASSPEYGVHGSKDGSRTLLRVTDESGFYGWSETAGNQLAALEAIAPALLSKSWENACLNLLELTPPDDSYWSRPVGPSPYTPNRGNLRHRLRHPLQGIVEEAILDMRARRLGLPVTQLLGGRWRDRVACDYWAGRVTPEHAARCTERALSLGFRGIKLKTTLEDPNVERFEAIKSVGGNGFKITLDPNGRFYRLDDALPTVLELDRIGNLAVLEDPFPRFYLPEFAALRKRITARVAVHLDPVESFWNVLTSGAAGGMNIDSLPIGPFQWRVLAGAAEQANLLIWHGSGLDLGVGTAWQIQLAASAPNCRLPGDQAGPWLREATLVKESFVVEEGDILVPEGPGIGVEVDLDAVDRYCAKAASWKDA